MNFVGLMRVKDEEQHIGEAIEALLPLCDRIFVLDDHSTDSTAAICSSYPQVMRFHSQFHSLDEARDKTWLLREAMGLVRPEWVIMVDGDEILEKDGPDKVRRYAKEHPLAEVMSFTVPYYWNDPYTVRVDGSFGRICRKSAFRVGNQPAPGALLFGNYSYAKGGLHCGSVPSIYQSMPVHEVHVALWHYGYMKPEVRRRKYEWYLAHDDGNVHEDSYQHIIQGDPGGPPAEVKLKLAGPLSLQSMEDFNFGRNFSQRPRGN